MQQTLEVGFWQRARFGGVLRYHTKALGRRVLLVLLILLLVQLASIAVPMFTGNAYPYMGVYADLSLVMVAALVAGNITANKSTRFLLRFGTSRFSVWLGNLIGLWCGMVGLLLGTLALNALIGGLVLLVSNALPGTLRVKSLFQETGVTALFQQTLGDALRTLPEYILYTLEWTAIFYLLGCCLRRNRWLTLGILIGVPMVLMLLTLLPAVRQAVDVLENANEQQRLLLGVQWMKILMDVVHFVENQWPWIQLGTAVISLPLSYLCMRSTPQP